MVLCGYYQGIRKRNTDDLEFQYARLFCWKTIRILAYLKILLLLLSHLDHYVQ